MANSDIEHYARRVCKVKGIDPDGTGWAVTEETRNRLGDSYKLWEYQIPVVIELLKEFID